MNILLSEISNFTDISWVCLTTKLYKKKYEPINRNSGTRHSYQFPLTNAYVINYKEKNICEIQVQLLFYNIFM